MVSSQIFRRLKLYLDGKSIDEEYNYIPGQDLDLDDFLSTKHYYFLDRWFPGHPSYSKEKFWEIIWDTNHISLEEISQTRNAFAWDEEWKLMLRKYIRQNKLDYLDDSKINQ